MTEEEYWFWLCTIKDMWQGKIQLLINALGHPRNIYYAKAERLLKIRGIHNSDIMNIIDSKTIMHKLKELEKFNSEGINFIYFGHKDYPERLLPLTNRPYCLFVKGSMPDFSKPLIAMIGARNCTNYGKQVAESIATELSKKGAQIISGFARGVDSYGQWGALKNGGKCFGVLGCGVDLCYPKENSQLYEMTIQNGGMISEYLPGTKPLAWHFPHRNRLISGLSDKLIVVEAKEKSGTLITVEHALEQGKDVYAVPGRINDPLSVGCNKLIKEGAAILTDLDDLLVDFEIELEKNDKKDKNTHVVLEKDFEIVYSCLDLLPRSLQQIIEESNVNHREVLRILVELQLLGLVEEPAKNFYSRKI